MRSTEPSELWENSRQDLWSVLHRVTLALFQPTPEPYGLLLLTTRLNLQPCEGNAPGFVPSIAHSTAPNNQSNDIHQ